MPLPSCYKCGVPLIRKDKADPDTVKREEFASEEHILPNFCGGQLVSWELLCQKCNNALGVELDAELSKQLLFHELFQIKLDRGKQDNGYILAYTQDTKREVLVNRKLEWKNFKPTFKISEKGLIEQFTARDKKEARLILEGIKRKFPATDVEASMARLVDVTEFLNEKIDFSHRQIGGYKTHRAIAKIAVNFYLYSGGGKSAIQDIIEYVCKPGIKNRFVTFYYSFMSLHNLGEKEISHLLFLKGDKVKGLLYCYIELFSTANFIVILDNNYDGESFVKQYCFDIVDHQELKNKSVKLSLFQDPFEWLKYKIENDKHFRRLKNIC